MDTRPAPAHAGDRTEAKGDRPRLLFSLSVPVSLVGAGILAVGILLLSAPVARAEDATKASTATKPASGAAAAAPQTTQPPQGPMLPPGVQVPPELLSKLKQVEQGSQSQAGQGQEGQGAVGDPALRPGAKAAQGVEETYEAIEAAGRQEESAAEETPGIPTSQKGRLEPRKAPSSLSAFELQLQAYADPLVGTPVLQFGYEVFARVPSTPTDAPVGPDYALGTGDNLVVSIWGTVVDDDYRVTIDRDGEVRLPQVGRVALKGLTLQGAEDALKRKFDGVYTNYNMQLRLGRLRDMPVHVIGRVPRPGRVRVSSVATLFDALGTAGGVTKDGSLRRVAVRRRGMEPRAIDLYSYLLEGDLSVDVSLSANDVIVVPPAGPRVAITGRVLRPAIYEILADEIRFDALLAMAGGYARLADRSTVQIESALRSASPAQPSAPSGPTAPAPPSTGLSVRTEDLAKTPASAIVLRDGDVAIVKSSSPLVESVVYLAGNVALPGRYAWRQGLRVSDVVTDQALIEAGFWLRRTPPTSAEVEAQLPEPFLDYALVRRIERPSFQEKRLAFHLGKAIIDKDPKEDILLQPQDTIIVFPRSAFAAPDMVFIAGAVHQPNDYRFFPGMRVRDLVRMAGGLLPEASVRSAVLTRMFPDQKQARFENISVDLEAAMAGDERGNIPLQRNDALSVRVVPEFRKPYRVEVVGEVRHPGTYTAIPGERLSDLLRRAGGFTREAYLPGAQFFRESVRVLQQQRLDEALQRLEIETKTAAQKFAAEAAAAGDSAVTVEAEKTRIDALIKTIRSTPAKGRMVIRVRAADELSGSADDVELADRDRLIVPRTPQEINVVGAVHNQTALLFKDGLTVEDYLQECGGATDSASMDLLFVIRADGTADSASSARRDYRWDSERGRYSRGDLLSSALMPGDTIIVPYDVEPKLSALALAKTVTQILFQTALATGVVVALI